MKNIFWNVYRICSDFKISVQYKAFLKSESWIVHRQTWRPVYDLFQKVENAAFRTDWLTNRPKHDKLNSRNFQLSKELQ